MYIFSTLYIFSGLECVFAAKTRLSGCGRCFFITGEKLDTMLEELKLLDNAISCMVFNQEFGLARFKKNQVKAMKGLEYALTNLQGT